MRVLYKSKTLEFYSSEQDISLNLPYFQNGVSAGFPSPAEDHIDSKIDLNQLLIEHPSATYYVRVNGDSMLDAGILNGDLLIVDRSLEVINNSIVVAYIDGDFTVKRIRKNKNKLFLQAENNKYQPIEITEEMDFELFGVVAHAIHHFI
ncbi:MAG: translesion error-prone DNA polymerase V autoproteolytic subunit [Flavobacteriales bacterium TMED191]|nr:MAG: translesion error-prone DNA polymerase V autoproteolytic subunit [Flavobacteriales bacterium TMED191]|tara:strand:+ start:1235 stop:1681 length:447 start_codon:yes stop_codon:yes gene_type:complete